MAKCKALTGSEVKGLNTGASLQTDHTIVPETLYDLLNGYVVFMTIRHICWTFALLYLDSL